MQCCHWSRFYNHKSLPSHRDQDSFRQFGHRHLYHYFVHRHGSWFDNCGINHSASRDYYVRIPLPENLYLKCRRLIINIVSKLGFFKLSQVFTQSPKSKQSVVSSILLQKPLLVSSLPMDILPLIRKLLCQGELKRKFSDFCLLLICKC